MGASTLQVDPSPDFGDVATGETPAIVLEVLNFIEAAPGEIITITDIAFDGAAGEFSLEGLPGFPLQVLPDATTNFTVRFSPTGTGLQEATIRIANTGSLEPNKAVYCSGTGITGGAGTKIAYIDPPTVVFPDTKVGDTSAEVTFDVENPTGGDTIQITGIDIAGKPFTLTTGSFPQNITAGNSYTLGLTFDPTVIGFVNVLAEIQGDMDATTNVRLQGQGFAITPAHVLTSFTQALFLAYTSTVGLTRINQVDPTSLDCEDDAYAFKEHNASAPTEEKVWTDLYLGYLDQGAGAVLVTLTDVNGNATAVTITLAGLNDGKYKRAVASGFEVEGEVVLIRFDVDMTTGGTVVIADYVLKYRPFDLIAGGQKHAIAALTPAHTITEDLLTMVLAFRTGVTSVIATVNPDDLNCSDQASAAKEHMVPFITESGMAPSFGYEKFVARILFHYTDLGVVTVTVQVTTTRGQVDSEAVTIGTMAAPGTVQLAFANLEVTDELHKVEFIRASGGGALEIIDYVVRYENKGEKQQPVP